MNFPGLYGEFVMRKETSPFHDLFFFCSSAPRIDSSGQIGAGQKRAIKDFPEDS
jgi:hypothetical protein